MKAQAQEPNLHTVLGFHVVMNGYINLIATVHGNTGFMELMEEGVVRWI